MSDTSLVLYSFPLSGNAHRAELALGLLGVEYENRTVKLGEGEHRGEAFKKLNPASQVPVLVDGETVVTESTAILTYLAAKFDDGSFMPADAAGQAEVQKWFAKANGPLQNGPASARLITLFGAQFDQAATIEKAHAFLAYLNAELEGKEFLVAGRPTFADVAIYSYVAHAPEGLVELTDYSNVTSWLARIEALEGFVGMQKTDVSNAA
ncbi:MULTISPECIES: glutathione S-transferase family protein [Kordiimonas]|uniref:glutathione S-transferase family protein n=1 Tax=Kordiimonas TaxID=288021 RepID=UPI001FF28B85|nr:MULTISPECIES: glutathione S-transferase [Kordiimonas]MCK0070224.1 glutathione S-transferase [Kordiimonas laminariae]UTW59006.1 glutathione S-transferase [Kordiimonas sp. SCSIO 12603]